MTDKQELNREELSAVEALSNKIVLLLAIAPISDEQRANLAEGIPQMNYEQLQLAVASLEASIADGAEGGAVSEDLKDKIRELHDDYIQKEKDAVAAAHAELDEIESLLNPS